MFENFCDSDSQILGTSLRHELHSTDGITTELKEAIIETNFFFGNANYAAP